jgi:hypothetical protein
MSFFVALIVAFSVVALTTLVSIIVNLMTSKPHRLRTGTLAVLLVASILLLTGATLWEKNVDAASADQGKRAEPSGSPVQQPSDPPSIAASSAPSEVPKTSATQVEDTPTPDVTEEESSTPPPVDPTQTPAPKTASKPPATQYLADLKPLYGDPGEGPATLGGNKVECGRSIRFPINGFQGGYTAEYGIDAHSSTFRATLGIDNKTKPGAKVNFLIYLDGELVNDGYLLTYYDTQELKLSVKGKSVLKLVTEVVAAGGVGGTGRSVWGNARFTVA